MIGLRNSNNSSFPRRRESSEQTFLIRSFFAYWIPAFAGMTNKFRGQSKITTGSAVADILGDFTLTPHIKISVSSVAKKHSGKIAGFADAFNVEHATAA